MDVGICQYDTLHLLHDVGKFSVIAFKETTPGRDIVEKIVNSKVATLDAGVKLLRDYTSALDYDAGATVRIRSAGAQGDL